MNAALPLSVFKNRLFLKILLSFLSLLIPILIIGGIVYYDVDKMVKKDVSEKLSDNLRFSAEMIDLRIDMATSTNNNIFLNDIIQRNLKPISLMSDENLVNSQVIVRALGSNQNIFSSFIDHIFLYNDTKRVYTSDGVVDFEVFFEKFYQISGYDSAFWREQLQREKFFQLLSPKHVKKYASENQIIPNVTTQYLNGYLTTMVTALSVHAIESMLVDNSMFDTTSYLILDQNHNVIINGSDYNKSVINQIHQLFPNGEDAVIARIDGILSVVAYIPSEGFGWHYYSITPVASFSHESQRIFNLILWICLSLMVVGGYFSFKFSVGLYNPIHNILKILTRTDSEQAEPARSTDDFKRIGNHILELVRENKSVTHELNKYSNELVAQSLTNLVLGNPPANPEMLERILDDIGFREGKYLCCCFQFHYKERFIHDIEENDRMFVRDKLKNVLWGIMCRYVDCYFLEFEPELHVCLVCLESENDRALLERGLESIRSTFEYDLIYYRLNAGLGKMYDNVWDLSKSYSDAITVMDRIGESDHLRFVDASEYVIDQMYYYSFMDEKRLLNVLRARNEEGLSAEIAGIVRMNKNRNVSYALMSNLLIEMFNTGVRYLKDNGIDIHAIITEAEYDELMDKLYSARQLDNRIEKLTEFYLRIIRRQAEIDADGDHKTGTVSDRIIRYIDEQYANDIYLEKIAQEIGLSAKHISRVFKSFTGMTISDYISSVRMTKAKEMLVNTEWKIADIARRVGIPSRTTFLRVFKKFEGISPTDYRNVHRGDD